MDTNQKSRRAYEQHFAELEKMVPKAENLPSGVISNFWECLYQTFKARFIAEQNAELKAMMDKEYEERVMD